MNKSILFYICSIFILPVLNIGFVKAQGATGFANGITIATKTEITPINPQNSLRKNKFYEKASDKENIIYRIIANEKTKTYFGYDLEVKETNEKGKYKVFIKPLSSENLKSAAEKDGFKPQTSPKYPDAVEINEGDLITLDVMENPQTKEKVTDYIKVFYKPADFTDFFAERTPIRDFTIDDIDLKIIKFEVFADNQSILKVGGGASGPNIFFNLKGKGRFIFSLFPRPGYDFQKIGEIENNKILFKYNGVDYKIVSSEPIVGAGGHWNLWVLPDPNYKSMYEREYTVGAASKPEYLFLK